MGNDIVNIVFESTDDPLHPSFSPTMMKSHFTRELAILFPLDGHCPDVFAVVTFEKTTGLWRLWVYSEESVPAFGPSIPHPNTFSDVQEFREFLLTKCKPIGAILNPFAVINAEKAAFNARVFVEKRQRTNDTLLKDMYMEYMKDCQSVGELFGGGIQGHTGYKQSDGLRHPAPSVADQEGRPQGDRRLL